MNRLINIMKTKRFFAGVKFRLINSVLDFAAWINWLGSEERRNPYRCPECGSTDIHTRAWIAPNKGSRFIEDIIDDGADDDWCRNCENIIRARPTDDLLTEANVWWGAMEFRDMERITGYRQYDFYPDDGYREFVDACTEWWESKPTEEQISIYFNYRP